MIWVLARLSICKAGLSQNRRNNSSARRFGHVWDLGRIVAAGCSAGVLEKGTPGDSREEGGRDRAGWTGTLDCGTDDGPR